MNYRQLFFVILLFFSCEKKDSLPILVAGHAGMGLDFPGSVYHANSKEAMNLALETPNCDGVEMDVRQAADGSIWLFHDETLDETTKSSGCVANKNKAELRTLQYKSLNKEKLVRLADITSFQMGAANLFLDIKHYNDCDNSIVNLNNFLDSLQSWKTSISNSEKRVFAVLGNPDWIGPFLNAGWNVLFSSDDAILRKQITIDFPSIQGFMCKNDLCSKNAVEQMRSDGKLIFLYEVRSPKSLKEVRDKRPTGVLSDDLQGAIIEFK